jgi:hypothetical protein
MIQELDKVVHQWCDDNDRWMYIEYDRDGKVMGLNFMQGDEYECFKKSWCVSDVGMTAFYKQMLYTFAYEQKNVPEHCFINSCMWAYHSAISEYEDNNCKIGNTTKCYANKCCKAISGR